ncbi:MAG: M23 family metallopeptidase, partial [Thermoleophilaceae bacterium]|nr:M23 family metallopeptidase [Thermoleophilaceae bacterium]
MRTRSVLTALAALLLTVAASLLVSSPPAGAAPGWSWPVEGEVLTGYRNGDDPYAGGQHRGIDIAAEAGTPVGAAAAGTVRFAGVAGSSGLTVSVRTSDGTLDTSYLHLSAVAVREGEQVAVGQRLGAVGTTGRRAVEAPHLHFGVRDAGSRHAYHDPLSYLPPAPRAAPEPPRVPVPVAAPVPVAPAPVRVPDPVRVPAGRRVRLPAERRV